MQTLLHFIEKVTFGLFALCFSFVCLYTPQLYPVHHAEAGAAAGGATEWTQVAQAVFDKIAGAYDKISSIANTAINAVTQSAWIKDSVLDGIAWTLAKAIISEMTSSIINWVNSGFEGSPAFITDMEGFLTQVADETFGQYLEELGGPFSFICAPFKLDVRVALAIVYENQRANAGQTAPPTCTLSGALANLENFIDGVDTFTSAGGWDTWFEVTANPMQYTPQGSVIAAQAQAQARIVNARNQEVSVAGFGQGFLSSKICEAIEGAGANKEKCTITTPGKVINEALTFQTSSGPRSLIAADEINEIVSAVFAQPTQKAITGSLGLLGLSGGTGYTYSGVPYTDQIASSGFTTDPNRLKETMEDALAAENFYASSTELYQGQLEAFALDLTKRPETRTEASNAAFAAEETYLVITLNIIAIATLLDDFAVADNDPKKLQDISQKFFELDVHTMEEAESMVNVWQTILRSD